MATCAHRPEPGSSLVPCAAVGGCLCKVEVVADEGGGE